MVSKKLCVALIVLLLVNSLSAGAVIQSKLRKGKGISLSNSDMMRSPAGKQYAVPHNAKQLYVKKAKSHRKKSLQSCLCSEGNTKTVVLTDHSGSIEKFNRCYETIGSCLTTVNKIRETERSVDVVCTEPFSFETLTTFTTSFRQLGCTSTKRHFKVSQETKVCRLTTRTATIQVVVPRSVTVEKLTNISTFIDTLTTTNACVQNLKSVSKQARKLTSQKVCAKRLTSATASIAAIKTIHEVIKQKANRSVNCIDETKISCIESSSCNSGSGNSNNGSNGNHNEW